MYDLINTGLAGDPVIIHSFSKEEVDLNANPPKVNYAANTLDKDMSSVWAADDGDVLSGDYKGDGEYIIYDLGSTYALNLVQFNTTNKSDAFGIQILVSTTGTNASDFLMVLPSSGDLLLSATNTTDFNLYEVDTNARYVKLLGYGRFNSTGDSRASVWTAIGEIEFFGSAVLSVSEADLQNNISIYPNPVKDNLYVKVHNNTNIESYKLHSIDGRLIMEAKIEIVNSIFSIDLSKLIRGNYILNLSSEDGRNISKRIIVSE